MNKKNLLAILAGFVVSFLLGMVIYGMLLKDYMTANTMAGANKPEEEMIWWAMLMGMLFGAVFINYVLNLANANDFMSGAKTALWLCLFMALSWDLYFWGGTNFYLNMNMVFVDVLASCVMGTVTGGVIGWVRGSVDKPAAAAA
jgi:hypothetical protein